MLIAMSRFDRHLAIAATLLAGPALAADFNLPGAIGTPTLTVTGQGPGKFGPSPPEAFALPAQISTPGLTVTGQGAGKFGPSPPQSFNLPPQITTQGMTVTGPGSAAPASGKASK